MIKCNAIHYKKTGALSSFAVRKRCSSCWHLYLLWVKIHFVHRLKLFKVKECGMTKNIIFWLWKCSECGRMDLSKTSLLLVGPVECELPKICLISYPFHSLLLRNRSVIIATPRVLYRSSIWKKVTHIRCRRSYWSWRLRARFVIEQINNESTWPFEQKWTEKCIHIMYEVYPNFEFHPYLHSFLKF